MGMCMKPTDVSFLLPRPLQKHSLFFFELRRINNGKQLFLVQNKFSFSLSHIQWCAANLLKYMIPQENGYD